MAIHPVSRRACIAALVAVCVIGCGAPSEPEPDRVEFGTAYSYDMYTHCGAREAKFAGEYWVAAGTATPQDRSPSGWDDPYQKGVMTRLSETEAVFEAGDRDKHYVLRPGAAEFLQICA